MNCLSKNPGSAGLVKGMKRGFCCCRFYARWDRYFVQFFVGTLFGAKVYYRIAGCLWGTTQWTTYLYGTTLVEITCILLTDCYDNVVLILKWCFACNYVSRQKSRWLNEHLKQCIFTYIHIRSHNNLPVPISGQQKWTGVAKMTKHYSKQRMSSACIAQKGCKTWL